MDRIAQENDAPEPVDPPSETTVEKSTRLRSLDALRGFDMFWIVGGEHLVHALAKHTHLDWLGWFSAQLRHPGWKGFALYDLIFPLFLFLAGVAIPFSLERQREKGATRKQLVRKALIRALSLVALGAIYNGALRFAPLEETRICSVLGYIGIAYFLAAMIYLFADLRHRIIWAVGILLGYWAALMWISVPGSGAGVLTPQGCITAYLDRSLLPWALNIGSLYDSQGILVTIPAIVTCLLGSFTGTFLRGSSLKKVYNALILLGAAAVCYGIGQLWETQLFISKELWNPTFVMHCAGWSLMLLGLFYLVIDALGFWRWSFFFIVIGMNPILIYLGNQMVNFEHTSNFLFGGITGKFDGSLRPVLEWTAYIITWWLVLLFCYRKKIFLKV